MSSKFTVRLRKQPTSTTSQTITGDLGKAKKSSETSKQPTVVNNSTSESAAKLDSFKKPTTLQAPTNNTNNTVPNGKGLPEKLISREEYIDNLLRTPPPPVLRTVTLSTRPIDSTTTGGTSTRPLTGGITDVLNGTGNGTNSTMTINSISASLSYEMYEQQRKAIDSNPTLFEKFRNLRITNLGSYHEEEDEVEQAQEVLDENDENDLQKSTQPDTALGTSAKTGDGDGDTLNEMNPPTTQSVRRLRTRCDSKVVRAFSADQSVVEVLPEHNRFEPNYVKDINYGVLRLPNSHQKVGSSKSYAQEVEAAIASQMPAVVSSSTNKRVVVYSSQKANLSQKKKLVSSGTKKSSLKKYSKDSSSSLAPGGLVRGRVLKPINLDQQMASAESISDKEPSLVDILNVPTPQGSLKPLAASGKLVRSCSSTNPAVVKPNLSPLITSVEDTFVLLKAANSMPELVGGKSSLEEDANNIKSNNVCKTEADPKPLKSLKMLGQSVQQQPSVPKIRDIIPSSKQAKEPASAVKVVSNGKSIDSKEVAHCVKKSQINETPKPNTASNSERTIIVNNKPYQLLNKIGSGGSSYVYQVYDSQLKRIVALKLVDLSKADKSIVAGFKDEIKLLSSLSDCKRVVRMFDYEFRQANKKQQLLIVMEKGDDDLASVLKSFAEGSRVKPNVIRFYWEEMLTAVNEIHERNVVHSDLKPVNFIIVSGKLKLIDFGIANKIQSNKTSVYKDHIIGTVDFMAPESIQKKAQCDGKSMVKFNQKADIWSLGVILYNLVYGRTPYSNYKDNFSKGMAIINDPVEYKPLEDKLVLDVIKQCLRKDPAQRPTAAELLNHAYLSNNRTDLGHSSSSSESLNLLGTSPSKSSHLSETDLSQMVSKMTPNTLKNFSNMTPNMLKNFSNIVLSRINSIHPSK